MRLRYVIGLVLLIIVVMLFVCNRVYETNDIFERLCGIYEMEFRYYEIFIKNPQTENRTVIMVVCNSEEEGYIGDYSMLFYLDENWEDMLCEEELCRLK